MKKILPTLVLVLVLAPSFAHAALINQRLEISRPFLRANPVQPSIVPSTVQSSAQNQNGGTTSGNGGAGGNASAGGLVRAGSVVSSAHALNVLNANIVRINIR